MRDKAAEQKKQERKFGVIGIIFFAVLANIAYLRGHYTASHIICGLTVFFFVVRFVIPPLLHWVFVGWMAVVGVIGRINTYILLTVVFFVLFTPTGLLMRLFGNDPMKRRYDSLLPSYWIPVEEKPIDKKRYEQRF